ncbi:MAG: DUF4097 family beta strand repeat-containing protein [Planctomycetota bacterium]
MPIVTRLLIAATISAAAATGAGCIIHVHGEGHTWSSFKTDWDESIDPELVARASVVRIVNEAGDIEVQRTDARPGLTAIIRTEDEDRLYRVTIRQSLDDGVLVIEPDWDGRRRSNESCDLWVRLPNIDRVELRSTAGDLELVGFEADASLDSGAGDIEVRDHTGTLEMDTSAGSVEVERASGPIAASSSAGDIELEHIGWPVEISTAAGDIEVSFLPDFDGTLELSTAAGSIEIDGEELRSGFGPSRSSEMSMGLAEHRSTLKTAAGDIEVSFSGPHPDR